MTTSDVDQQALDRETIEAVVRRHRRGLTLLDAELMVSCFHDDATEVHGSYPEMPVVTEWIPLAIAAVPKRYERWRKTLCSIDIDLEGDVAHVDTFGRGEGILRERQDGNPVFRIVAASGYDRFERRNGEWRIARKVVVGCYDDRRVITYDLDSAWLERMSPCKSSPDAHEVTKHP